MIVDLKDFMSVEFEKIRDQLTLVENSLHKLHDKYKPFTELVIPLTIIHPPK